MNQIIKGFKMAFDISYSVYIESNDGTKKADVLTNLKVTEREAKEIAYDLHHIVKDAGYKGKTCKVVNCY